MTSDELCQINNEIAQTECRLADLYKKRAVIRETLKPPRRPSIEERGRSAMSLARQGLTAVQIAAQFNVKLGTVNIWLKQGAADEAEALLPPWRDSEWSLEWYARMEATRDRILTELKSELQNGKLPQEAG